jgi:hypothetical protein
VLRISLILQEPSDCEEHNQDNEDNPNIDAHQSRLLPPARTRNGCGAHEQLTNAAACRRFDASRNEKMKKESPGISAEASRTIQRVSTRRVVVL